MTYRLTPRWERLRTLHAAREHIEAQIRALETADTDPPPEPETPTATTQRHNHARTRLLRWAATPEFRAKVAAHGGAPTADQEMTA